MVDADELRRRSRDGEEARADDGLLLGRIVEESDDARHISDDGRLRGAEVSTRSFVNWKQANFITIGDNEDVEASGKSLASGDRLKDFDDVLGQASAVRKHSEDAEDELVRAVRKGFDNLEDLGVLETERSDERGDEGSKRLLCERLKASIAFEETATRLEGSAQNREAEG